MSQIEDVQGKCYQEMPQVDVPMVREEKIPPGTMKQILVHASLGHEGIGLLMPITGGDLRCMHPKAKSLMTTARNRRRSHNGETEEDK